jgi:hypothetical protein
MPGIPSCLVVSNSDVKVVNSLSATLLVTHLRFREWPNEALKSVANSFLADVELGDDVADGSGAMLRGVVDTCVFVHQSVERRSKKFYDELRRCVMQTADSC